MNTTLKLSRLLTITALAFGLAAGGTSLASTAVSSGHDHPADAKVLALNNGTKWPIDAPLSRAMTNIRNAVHADLESIHADSLPRKEYLALARTINGEVAYMIDNCDLEPEADAQLHLIIAELLEAATAMEGEIRYGSPRDGAVKVLGALDNYARYFDDPQFESVAH